MSPPSLNSPEEEEYVRDDDSGGASTVLSSDTNTSHGTTFGRVAATAKPLLLSWVTKTQAVQVKSAMKHSVVLNRVAFLAFVCVNFGLLAKFGFHANKETDIDPVGALARIEKELQETHFKLQLEIRQQEQIIKSANDRIAFLKQQMATSPPQEVNEAEEDKFPSTVSFEEKYAEIRDSLDTSARTLLDTTQAARAARTVTSRYLYYYRSSAEAAETVATEILSLVKLFDACIETYENLANEAKQWKTETAKLVRQTETLKQQKRALYIIVVLNALLGVATWWLFTPCSF